MNYNSYTLAAFLITLGALLGLALISLYQDWRQDLQANQDNDDNT